MVLVAQEVGVVERADVEQRMWRWIWVEGGRCREQRRSGIVGMKTEKGEGRGKRGGAVADPRVGKPTRSWSYIRLFQSNVLESFQCRLLMGDDFASAQVSHGDWITMSRDRNEGEATP